jgi:hypothetical protein
LRSAVIWTPEAAFLDRDIRPHLCEQAGLADKLGRMRNQDEKDIEGSIAKMDGNARLLEQPARRKQAEGTEGY